MLTTLFISTLLTLIVVCLTSAFYMRVLCKTLDVIFLHFGVVLLIACFAIYFTAGLPNAGFKPPTFEILITYITMYGIVSFIALLLVMLFTEIVKE